MEHKLYIAPECKHLIAEFKKYKYPAITSPRIVPKCSDHLLDRYPDKWLVKLLRSRIR